jgi:spore coat polysaccharide biosynthesis predicted glycosyltransferase SpsG
MPFGIIKPEEMKNILWDVMRSQTLASELSFKDSTINIATKTNALTKKVFEIHKTDSAHFNESYNWYVKHPLKLKIIFDSLYAQKQRVNLLQLKEEIKHHQ